MRSLLKARLDAVARRGPPRRRRRQTLRLATVAPAASRASLELGAARYPCALGRAGTVTRKREGDCATPAGIWPLTAVLYRPDRRARPVTGIACLALGRADGWCDDPASRAYNQPIGLPAVDHHEMLWRDDGIYDLMVVLEHNRRPAVPGRGSAIFIHLARPGRAPTAGCIALSGADLSRLLARLGPRARIVVGPHMNRPARHRGPASRRR
jgi:L,D-peptidoglycan transpeptidase YkuD (ErfK/YbiS/YcfS/YnhG family)